MTSISKHVLKAARERAEIEMASWDENNIRPGMPEPIPTMPEPVAMTLSDALLVIDTPTEKHVDLHLIKGEYKHIVIRLKRHRLSQLIGYLMDIEAAMDTANYWHSESGRTAAAHEAWTAARGREKQRIIEQLLIQHDNGTINLFDDVRATNE